MHWHRHGKKFQFIFNWLKKYIMFNHLDIIIKLLNWFSKQSVSTSADIINPSYYLLLLEKLKKRKRYIVPCRSTYPTPASADFSAHAFPRNQPFCEQSNLSTSSPHQQEVLNSRSKRISNIWLSSYRSRCGTLVLPALYAQNDRDTPSCFQRKFDNERNGRSFLAVDPSSHPT